MHRPPFGVALDHIRQHDKFQLAVADQALARKASAGERHTSGRETHSLSRVDGARSNAYYSYSRRQDRQRRSCGWSLSLARSTWSAVAYRLACEAQTAGWPRACDCTSSIAGRVVLLYARPHRDRWPSLVCSSPPIDTSRRHHPRALRMTSHGSLLSRHMPAFQRQESTRSCMPS